MKSLNLKRVLAYVIDILIVGMLSSFISLIPMMRDNRELYNNRYEDLVKLNEKYDNKEMNDEEYRNQYIPLSYELNRINTPYIIVDLIVLIGYFAIFQWQRNGKTLGKQLMKIVVVSANDEKIGFINYFIRTLILNNIFITIAQLGTIYIFNVSNYYPIYSNINLVGVVLLYAIIFSVLIRQDSRGLHDLLANTKVVSLAQLDMDKKEEPLKQEKKTEIKNSKKEAVVLEASFEEKKLTKKSTKSKK